MPIMAAKSTSGTYKISKSGTSLVIRITQEAKYLKVKEGDWVEVTMKKLNYIPEEESEED